jgi:hypothetical protein
MKRNLYILLLVLGIVAFNNASAQLLPNFGGQRAGLSSLSFLKNDMSPRSAGLSGTSVALSGDAFSLYSNPASATDAKGFTLATSNLSLGAGVQQSYVSAIFPRKNESAFGVSMNILNSGKMDVRTEFQPEGTGEKFYVTNMALGLTYSKKLSDMFSAGVSFKYIYEQIAEYRNSTVAVDVSFLYYTDYKDLKFAVMVQNFGGNSALSGDEVQVSFNRDLNSLELQDYTVPTVFKLGASIVPLKKDRYSLTTAIQLNHPNDNAENYRVGLEFEYMKLLFVRSGIKLNIEGQGYPTFGLGVRANVAGFPIHIDYAANPTEYFGFQHMIGLSMAFNKMEER